jgi:hypothetical protein
MKHIALIAAFVTLGLMTIASAAPAPTLELGEPAVAAPQPVARLSGAEPEAPVLDEATVELASYFSMMRAFKRICYSDAVGYYYCG